MGLHTKNVLVLVLFSAMCLGACQPADSKPSDVNQTKKIIVYGLTTCDHCIQFKAQLDSLGISYDFRDMKNNEALTDELIDKIRAARIVGQINYPVVDVEGTILVSPELSQVLSVLNY